MDDWKVQKARGIRAGKFGDWLRRAAELALRRQERRRGTQECAKFDILPEAQPFSLFATAGGLAPNENVEIGFNPAKGTFSGTASTPTAQSRAWDFSEDGFSLIDLLTGGPFPGNVMPLSRVDAAAGSTFLVGDSTNSALSAFAGYLGVYVSPAVNIHSTMLKLYVDGILVSTSAVPFQTP